MSWLLLLAVNLFTFFELDNSYSIGLPVYIQGLLLNVFFAATFFFLRIQTEENSQPNFLDMLSGVFLTSCVTFLLSVFIQFVAYSIERWDPAHLAGHSQITVALYHVQIGLIIVFLTKAFFVWKRMVLYQGTRRLRLLWKIFEGVLLTSMVINFFVLDEFSKPYIAVFAPLAFLGLVLSFNLRWVPYLNMKEKWQGMLILLLMTAFIAYFVRLLDNYSHQGSMLGSNILYSVYIGGLFAFVLSYCVISVIVILFNLPTSSVFEEKLEEVLNFQQLTQSLQMKENENQVYETLLESATKAMAADAGWIEILGSTGKNTLLLTGNLFLDQVTLLTEVLHARYPEEKSEPLAKNIKKELAREIREKIPDLHPVKSFVRAQLLFQDEQLGSLTLLKNEKDGFSKEKTELLNTYIRMSAVAIENFRLIGKAIENERYQESLAIAKKVQQNLLPAAPVASSQFAIAAFSQAAEEVGGDYYDFYTISEDCTALIIGDVSGKGTSAAFQMAQLKGIFHSLAEQNLSPGQFLPYANNVLSRCLDKTHFVTATYFILDKSQRKIQFSRAGHCPMVYFSINLGIAEFHHGKGLGLGIIRNKGYHHYVESYEIIYQPGDMIVLYTDGIVEARNSQNEEYGYQRLLDLTTRSHTLSADEFITLLKEDVYAFCGNRPMEDDYTAMVIKFI